MSEYLGFDFGTSNSVVSIFDSQTKKLKTIPISNYSDPRLKVQGEGGLFPSKLGLHNNKYYFGDETKVCSRDFIWTNSKRLLDTTDLIQEFYDDRSALEIAIGIISGIVLELEKQNIKLINKTCMTVPSNSYSLQRAQTKLAGEVAGLNVKNLVSEPCAAALSMLDNVEKSKNILVIDIGGGTTDIALLENNMGLMKETSVAGIKLFGGTDIDKAIFSDIESLFTGLTNAEKLLLIDECEKIKIELSEKNKSIFKFKENKIEFTRDRLQVICKPFIKKIEVEIFNVLKNSKIDVKNVDKVIPVGGTTLIPAFKEMFRDIFGANKVLDVSVDEALTAVSKGGAIAAAIYDGGLKNIDFQQCLEHSVALRVSQKVDYENYRFNSSIDASTKAEEMGSFGSHVGKSKDGEIYFYPCETFSELKSALSKSSNLSTKKLSLLIEKGTPYPAYHAKKFKPERSKSTIAIYETISNDINSLDSVLLAEWSLRTLRNNEVYVWVEVQYNPDGEIEIAAFQVDKFDEDLMGDMLETDISKEDYKKIGQMFSTEALSEEILLEDLIYDVFSKEKIIGWRDSYFSNLGLKRSKTISKDLDQEKLKRYATEHSLNDSFLAVENSWRDAFLYVLNSEGISSKEDFEEVVKILKNKDEHWSSDESVNLDDGRFLSKLFLSSENVKLLKKYKRKSFHNEIKKLHNLTNEYFHRDGRSQNPYEGIYEIEKNIAESTLQKRWYEKSELDPIFFKKISTQYLNVLDELINISKLNRLKDIKKSVEEIINNVVLKL